MNKSELVAAMVEKAGLTKKDAEAALAAFTNTVVETVANGDKVQLIGFGTFESTERSARKGRNPQTGKEIEIAACRAPKFKAGALFKASMK